MAKQTVDLSHIAEPLRRLAVSIETLSPDPKNARKHGERNLEVIRDSLSRFGQRLPLVAQRNGTVRVGSGRLAAARALGWTHVAVVTVDDDDASAAEFALVDNKSAELAEWDDGALAEVLRQIDPGRRLELGFSEVEFNRLMAELGTQSVAQDAEVLPAAEAASRRGDLWILGDQRLLCGDSTSVEDVRRLMNGQRAVLFATDPPYLVNYDGTNHPSAKKNWNPKRNKDWSETYGTGWDDADANSDLYDKFVGVAIAEAIREDAAWYCWHASRRQAMLEAVWVKHGAFVHQQIIWTKNRPVLTRSWYLWKHEPCLMGWLKSKKPPRTSSEYESSVWDFPTVGSSVDAGHPTSKPVQLFAIPMRQHTAPGEVCFEPFSGSGSQLIAAEQLGRRCFAMELQPQYVDVAVRRWQRMTGKEAVLDGSGATFAQTAAERGVQIVEPDPQESGDGTAEREEPAQA